MQCFVVGPQEILRDDKEPEICITGFKFESGCAFLVRGCDSRSFIYSFIPTKYVFYEDVVSSDPKNIYIFCSRLHNNSVFEVIYVVNSLKVNYTKQNYIFENRKQHLNI